MAFCRLSVDAVANNTTSVDNIFINNYLPYAKEECVKVYLYGLYKCQDASSKDNTLENFANELKMSVEEVESCFYYWQEQGLVQILEVIPFEVRYLPITNALNGIKKYNVKKYATFNTQAQEILAGRMITPKEYEEYYNIIENYHMEKEALIMVIKYCVDAKNDEKLGYSYIVTVAKDWANRGILTAKQIENQILQFETLNTGLEYVFKTLKLKRLPSVSERTLYKTWRELGFDDEVILYVAKNLKKSNFEYLDALLKKYFSLKLLTKEEIENFESEKKASLDIAKKITRNLGLYYENLEPVVENYVYKWFNLGFSVEMLERVANYAFKTSVRTLDGMDRILQKFHKLGILSAESLNEYFNSVLSVDKKIKGILESIGLSRNVNQFDRDKYKIWKENWLLPDEVIDYACPLALGKEQPMQYLNMVLSSYHDKNIKTLDDAKNAGNIAVNKKEKMANKRNYSREEMNALFQSIDEIEV